MSTSFFSVGMIRRRATGIGALGVLGLALTGGCGGPLVRLPQPSLVRPQGPPSLARVQDLGGLPLPALGPLSIEHSDALLTPGEWLALHGKNLTSDSKVTLGGRPAVVAGTLAGGALLVRVPRGVQPGMQPLQVDNGVGTAQLTVATALYAFGGDAQGNAVRIRRLGSQTADGLDFEEQAFDIPFPLARFQALSPDGAILYALQEPTREVDVGEESESSVSSSPANATAVVSDLLVIHMGGKGGPRQVARVSLTLQGNPTGLQVGPFGQLVILQERQLTVCDTTNPLAPTPVAQLVLAGATPKRELIDAEFLGNGRQLVVLEAFANQAHLIDLQVPSQPRLISSIALSQVQDQPYSIDLAPGPDPLSLWVLQGPNMRLAGKRLVDGISGAWKNAKELELKAAAKTLGNSAMSSALPTSESLSKLQQLVLANGQLQLAKSIPLPAEVFPFFVQPDYQGSLYVSGVNRKNQFTDLEASLDGVKRLLGALKDTAQLGLVLKVGVDSGQVVTATQGVAIYYDLALLPGGQLMTSTVRLGPGYIPPRLTLDWGFEVPGHSFSKLREVANTALKITEAVRRMLPPYRYERIGVQ